jgi:hypothetical protein
LYLYLSLVMENKTKNVKISEIHHEMLKNHCEKNGLKIYKVIEKWIEEHCKPKKKDMYGDD